MRITDPNEKTTFTLLAHADDKLSFDWPTGACPPGPWGAKVYAALKNLRNVFTQQSPPNVPLVDGILLGWVYTAMETETLRAENDDLRKRVGVLEHDLANVLQLLANRASTRNQ